MQNSFEIQFLDHVAIRVTDLERSQHWYQEILGLEILTFQEWGDYPVFMVKENFGVALFPANTTDPPIPISKNVKIDHFAFRVTPFDFEAAKHFFSEHEIEFVYEDHVYFRSLYLHDPDGHIIELTTPTKLLPG